MTMLSRHAEVSFEAKAAKFFSSLFRTRHAAAAGCTQTAAKLVGLGRSQGPHLDAIITAVAVVGRAKDRIAAAQNIRILLLQRAIGRARFAFASLRGDMREQAGGRRCRSRSR